MPRANGKWMILLCRCSVKIDFQGKGESGFGMSSAGGESGGGASSLAAAAEADSSPSGSGDAAADSPVTAAGDALAAGEGDGFFLWPSWAATAEHVSRSRSGAQGPQVRAACRWFMRPLPPNAEG